MKLTPALSSFISTPTRSNTSVNLMAKVVAITFFGLSVGAAYADPVADPIPMPTYSQGNSDLVNKGAYVARVADCMACHQEDYSGGVPIETPMGTIYGTNITPSVRYGIGNYTEQDLRDALKHGRAPNHRLYPAMPYPAYSGMTDEDIHALFAYMQTIPPHDEAPNHETKLPFPFNIRSLMIGWNLINMPDWQPREGLDETQRRGEYIVNNLEHCGTCHTPRNATMGYDMSQYLAGSSSQGTPNITPHETTGIGSWSHDEITTYLRHGAIENKALAGGAMGEVVSHSTRYLSDDDLNAIASYLKAIPAIETEHTVHPVNTAALPTKHSDDIEINLLEQIDYLGTAKSQAKLQSKSSTEQLYLAKCASCHGVNGYGQTDAGYASIVGLSSLRSDSAAPVIDVISNGVKSVVNTRPRMPGFKDELTPEQIADLSNYVRTKFGTLQDSQVTADAVSKQLSSGPNAPFLIKNAGWLSIIGIIVGLAILFYVIRWVLMRNRHKSDKPTKTIG